MSTSFAIGIPTLNRMDLLAPALETYLKLLPATKIFIIDNGQQQHPVIHQNIIWQTNIKNIGVAASWNLLCDYIFYYAGNALLLNDDVVLGINKTKIETLLKKNASIYTSYNDWCAAIIPRSTWTRIGRFDQNFFPAYYEDRDYEYRIKLAGLGKPVRASVLAPAIYRNNSTAEKDPSIIKLALNNRDYYVKKWGGMPGVEKYLVPFDGK